MVVNLGKLIIFIYSVDIVRRIYCLRNAKKLYLIYLLFLKFFNIFVFAGQLRLYLFSFQLLIYKIKVMYNQLIKYSKNNIKNNEDANLI